MSPSTFGCAGTRCAARRLAPVTPSEPAGDVELQIVRTVPGARLQGGAARRLPDSRVLPARAPRRRSGSSTSRTSFSGRRRSRAVLVDKLTHPPTPDFRLLLVLPAKANSGADDTRGVLGELIEADADAGRLLACTLYARSGALTDPVYVHAKIAIVDDAVADDRLGEPQRAFPLQRHRDEHRPPRSRPCRGRRDGACGPSISSSRTTSCPPIRSSRSTSSGSRSARNSSIADSPGCRSPTGSPACRTCRGARVGCSGRFPDCSSTADRCRGGHPTTCSAKPRSERRSRRSSSSASPSSRSPSGSCALVVALLFLAIVISAAMRPGIEALRRRRVPTGVGIAVHYLALVGLFALIVWLVVPRALTQVENALGVSGLPTSAGDLNHAANALDRRQARHPRRAAAPPRTSAVRVEARPARSPGRGDRVRDPRRHLLRLRERRLLDLRARPRRRPRLLAAAATEAKART